jgi:hypothetical protein
MMQTTTVPKDIEQLLTEADALINQIESDAIRDLEEEHRIQIERHAQSLKRLRGEVQAKIDADGSSESGSYYEGMHKAILEIMTAVKSMGKFLS